jgi:hypothetical protein
MILDASRMIPFRSKSSSIAQKSLERLNAARSGFVCFPEEDTMTRDEYDERLRARQYERPVRVEGNKGSTLVLRLVRRTPPV